MASLPGDVYDGDYVNGRMSSESEATYKFPNGTMYKGTFKNGTFHGKGVLVFKDMGKYTGVWKDGQLLEGSYTFEDGLKHEETKEWYCTEKDRRYYGEHLHGVPPAGESAVRCEKREGKNIPRGTYDVNDGYFSPTTGKVMCYKTGKVVRTPTEAQRQVILARAYLQH